MAIDQNPYQAYTDGSIFSDNPLNLVVALYQGALDATQQAELAVHAKDIPGRTKAINKAISILTELLVSLDVERGGEIGKNLRELYGYMQKQLITAHIRQVAEPITEVSKLLTTLLEGWRGVQTSATAEPPAPAYEMAHVQNDSSDAYANGPIYGGYLEEGLAASARSAYSF